MFTNHTQPQTQTQTVPSASVVESLALTPQTSLLEMSDDGNRLFVNTGVQGLSIWDKNDAGVWGYRDGLTEGHVIHLSNNGNYLSVDYGNTARLYEIDSNGQMSKIGDDITPSDVNSVVSTFRSNQPTHINIATSNSGVLNLASYVDTTRIVEISSLTWDPTQSLTVSTSQSSEITGFTVPTGSETTYSWMLRVIHGIALSGNGETLVVYDDTHFHVYTHDGSPSGNAQDGNEWTFRRTKTVSGYQNPLGAFAISYDGTLLAYKGLPDANDEIIIENAVSGTSMGNIPQTSDQGRTISFEFRNNYYLVLRFPGVYNPPIYNQWVQRPEQRYHPFLFYEYVGGTMWTMVTHYPTLVLT